MHRLIAHQIAKATAADGTVDVVRLSELVNGAYEDLDRDRRRTDRSMSLMIEEIDAVNRKLERLVEERTRELRAREIDLQAQNVRFDAALSNMSQGLTMFDVEGRLIMCNGRYLEIYRLQPDDVRPGMLLRELVEARIRNQSFAGDPDQFVAEMMAAGREQRPMIQQVELMDGRTLALDVQPMADGGWVATHEDITERKRAELKIAHMARHDSLTDLPNRVLLNERLADALGYVERGQQLAVFCLDLDQFKNVNDTLGHPVGDELLRKVAARLRSCVRETDTISRVGGDEFSIVQSNIAGA
ncbi:MAG TPA: PAS-domain containing protein, partial [Bradyrhizobium sp.]|nr:PAS-domain containing protein [Bradyrhizobium sp.]